MCVHTTQQDWLHGEDEFSIAFMLWEMSDNVPPPQIIESWISGQCDI